MRVLASRARKNLLKIKEDMELLNRLLTNYEIEAKKGKA